MDILIFLFTLSSTLTSRLLSSVTLCLLVKSPLFRPLKVSSSGFVCYLFISIVMLVMRGVCGCHGDERGTVRMLNELGVAQANEVGRLYLGLCSTSNNERMLVKSLHW